MPDFNQMQRRRLAAKRQAMPDGGFPIRNVADLKNAIQAFGRAKNKPAVKAWIKKRARELGATNLLPDNWRSDTLVHYGVKGMKWGVRRYRDENGKLTKEGKNHYQEVRKSGGQILGENTSFHRISTAKENLSEKHTYVSFLPKDNDFYKEALTTRHVRRGAEHVYDISYKNVSDLIIPSHKVQVDEFIKMYSNDIVKNRNLISEDLADKAVKNGRSYGYSKSFIKESYNKKLSDIEKSEINRGKTAYSWFMSSYENSSLSSLYESRLIEKGYNAIIDDHDRLYDTTSDKLKPDKPLIVFDPKNTMKIDDISEVTYNDYLEAQKRNRNRIKTRR